MTGSKGGKNSKEEELNLRGYAGEWVVIRENKVAAHNKTLEQLLQEGTYQEDDVLFLVPPKEQFYLSGKT